MLAPLNSALSILTKLMPLVSENPKGGKNVKVEH